jgi:hypothetical protein
MYGLVIPGRPIQFGRLVAVRTPDDLEYLIKERELLESQEGRVFHAHLNDVVLRFRVCAKGSGYEVVAATTAEQKGTAVFVARGDLLKSTLGQAMAHGRLFCDAI